MAMGRKNHVLYYIYVMGGRREEVRCDYAE